MLINLKNVDKTYTFRENPGNFRDFYVFETDVRENVDKFQKIMWIMFQGTNFIFY